MLISSSNRTFPTMIFLLRRTYIPYDVSRLVCMPLRIGQRQFSISFNYVCCTILVNQIFAVSCFCMWWPMQTNHRFPDSFSCLYFPGLINRNIPALFSYICWMLTIPSILLHWVTRHWSNKLIGACHLFCDICSSFDNRSGIVNTKRL